LESVRLGLSYAGTECCERCLVREQCDVQGAAEKSSPLKFFAAFSATV